MIPVNLEISNLLTPFTNAYKAISDEWKHFFEMGVSEYLQSQTEKYYYINTFLHRSEKVKFWDIYFPVRITYKYFNSPIANLKDTLEEYKYITLIGTAGSGKSTLVKGLFLDSIKQNFKIPLLIELRHFNDYDESFENFVLDSVLHTDLKPSESTLRRTLKSGKFLFLLDGYDELFITDRKGKKRQLNLFREISNFIEKYQNNNFIITTRPGSGIERLHRFYDFHVCDLDEGEVKSFVSNLVESTERKERILTSIDDPRNGSYREYLSNPLLLSMYILAFESHPEIPSKRSAFYRNVFDTLYSKHDGITKNSFPRERLSKLDRDDFEKILNIFSYLTLLKGYYSYTEEVLNDHLSTIRDKFNYDFDVNDLIYDFQTSISILIKDGFEFKFPHRSIQEYFTAQFISKLPTNKKEKAYQKIDYTLKVSSKDESFNFWSICNELDSIAFNKHFLIPHLQRIALVLNKKDRSLLFDAFINLSDIALILDADGSVDTSFAVDFNYGLIEFSQSINYLEVSNFISEPKIQSKLKAYIRETAVNTKEGDRSYLPIDSALKEILISGGIMKIIEGNCKDLLSKINELENYAVDYETSIDEFLDT